MSTVADAVRAAAVLPQTGLSDVGSLPAETRESYQVGQTADQKRTKQKE